LICDLQLMIADCLATRQSRESRSIANQKSHIDNGPPGLAGADEIVFAGSLTANWPLSSVMRSDRASTFTLGANFFGSPATPDGRRTTNGGEGRSPFALARSPGTDGERRRANRGPASRAVREPLRARRAQDQPLRLALVVADTGTQHAVGGTEPFFL
jgi:hypothetical protein